MVRFALVLVLYLCVALGVGLAARPPNPGPGSGGGDGASQFFQACRAGDPEPVLAQLRSHPQLVDLRDDDRGRSCLLWAAERGHLELLRSLLAEPWQADPLLADSTGSTALHLAAANGHSTLVRAWVVLSGIHPDGPRDLEGFTALMRAASVGQLGVVQLLIQELGSDPALVSQPVALTTTAGPAKPLPPRSRSLRAVAAAAPAGPAAMLPPKLDCFAVAAVFGQSEVMLWLLQESPVRVSIRLADESPDVDLQQVLLKAIAREEPQTNNGRRPVGSIGHRLAEELLHRNIFLHEDAELRDYLLAMPELARGPGPGKAAAVHSLVPPAEEDLDPLELSALRSLQLLRTMGLDRRAADLLAERGGFTNDLWETPSSRLPGEGGIDIRLAELVRWSPVELELRLGELSESQRAWFLPHWEKLMAQVRSRSPLAQAAASAPPTSLRRLWDVCGLRLREAMWRGIRACKGFLGNDLWKLVAAVLRVY